MVTITNKSTNKLLHSAQSTEGFKKVLGIPALVLFGLAYMVPLAAFTTYGLVTQITAGHLPTAYLVTLLAMLFTAYSYGRMVYAHPYAGSVYSYTRKTFGSSLGFLAGWTLLLDYIFLPMLCQSTDWHLHVRVYSAGSNNRLDLGFYRFGHCIKYDWHQLHHSSQLGADKRSADLYRSVYCYGD